LVVNRYLCKRHQIFSCLFVKFVLYMAGFLGEGILLFRLFCTHEAQLMEKYSYIVPILGTPIKFSILTAIIFNIKTKLS